MTRELSFGRGSARGILRVPFALTVMGLGFALGGCGHTLYVFQANSAASRLEEARELLLRQVCGGQRERVHGGRGPRGRAAELRAERRFGA